MFRNLIQSAVRASTLPRCTFGEFQERQIYFWDYRCIFVPADEQVRVDKVSNGNYTSISAYAIQYMQVTLRSTRLGPSVEIEGRTHKCKLFFLTEQEGLPTVILLKIKNVLCTKRTKNKKGRPKPTKKVTIEPIPSMRIVAEQFLVLLCIAAMIIVPHLCIEGGILLNIQPFGHFEILRHKDDYLYSALTVYVPFQSRNCSLWTANSWSSHIN
jgi:hypothetical protein